MIPKPGGGERPLGIPTVRDRVVQTAAKLVLEPIFKGDLNPAAHGYRPRRRGADAIKAVHALLRRGCTDVVDADLSKYFNTIPHQDLMRSVARRIVDRHVLRLIKLWLKAPVEERDNDGTRRMPGGKNSKQRTLQGADISPLLANPYMNRFLKHWRGTGRGSAIVRIFPTAESCLRLVRPLAVEMLENWLEATRYLNMNHLKEHKKRPCGPWPPDGGGRERRCASRGLGAVHAHITSAFLQNLTHTIPVGTVKARSWRRSEGVGLFSSGRGPTGDGRSSMARASAKRFDWRNGSMEAYQRVRANQGAAGVAGQSIADFEADLSNSLYKLWNRGRRRSSPMRRAVSNAATTWPCGNACSITTPSPAGTSWSPRNTARNRSPASRTGSSGCGS
jgi:retron-type reverse transcriptase